MEETNKTALFDQVIAEIEPASEQARADAYAAWGAVAKPLGGLGMLEDIVCRLAGAQHTANVVADKRAVAVFCADNGIVEEGVTQSTHEVTTAVTMNLCRKATSVCRMAASAHCDVVPVDVGVLDDIDDPRLRVMKTAHGTANIAKGPAMTREQAIYAIEAGMRVARELAEEGCTLLAAGEMGIGNTSSSAAVACALLEAAPEEMVGRGAGLSSEGLARKVAAVGRALAVNLPDRSDPVDVLAKVGGFDIAAMCGFYLGAASKRTPVLLDGVISCVAGLCATGIAPDALGYLVASHVSTEPAAHRVLAALGLEAPLHAGMHLGEGTGAVALMPLIDMTLAVYHDSATFEATGIDAYEVLV